MLTAAIAIKKKDTESMSFTHCEHPLMQRSKTLTHGLQDKLVLGDGQWSLNADHQL